MRSTVLVNPTTLLGKEMRDTLGARRSAWSDVRLLSSREDEIGSLSEIGDAAALVARLEPGSFAGVDVAFFCGAIGDTRPLLAELPDETTAIVLSTGATAADGRPVVAGVNDGANVGGGTERKRLLSPHPAVILLAHLLHPLRGLGIEEAAATVIQPASVHDDAGIEELFEQTRQIVAISPKLPSPIFGSQLTFNVLPVPAASDPLREEIRQVLANEPPVSLQLLQGGIFHSLAASLYVRCASGPTGPPDVKALRKALGGNPHLELVRKPGHLGPIDAAAHDKVLVGTIQQEAEAPGGFWLWAVMDNLTRGGALNALALAESIL